MSKKSPSTFLFSMKPWRGKIVGEATNQISQGGNYIVRKKFRAEDTSKTIKSLRGKATDGSSIKLVEAKNIKKSFIRFNVDPITGINQGAPRAELAPPKMLDFGQTAQINIVFRVRAKNLDVVTGYVLQFWQPVISPIGGIRANNGRLEAVTRSGGEVASSSLNRRWNRLSMEFRPGAQGLFKVSGDLQGTLNARIDGGSQAGRATDDIFRPKFGWYGPARQNVSVDFRRFEMSVI
jgi:hypothetical protein